MKSFEYRRPVTMTADTRRSPSAASARVRSLRSERRRRRSGHSHLEPSPAQAPKQLDRSRALAGRSGSRALWHQRALRFARRRELEAGRAHQAPAQRVRDQGRPGTLRRHDPHRAASRRYGVTDPPLQHGSQAAGPAAGAPGAAPGGPAETRRAGGRVSSRCARTATPSSNRITGPRAAKTHLPTHHVGVNRAERDSAIRDRWDRGIEAWARDGADRAGRRGNDHREISSEATRVAPRRTETTITSASAWPTHPRHVTSGVAKREATHAVATQKKYGEFSANCSWRILNVGAARVMRLSAVRHTIPIRCAAPLTKPLARRKTFRDIAALWHSAQ